mmetsp:Transcript_19387/g.49331  ORF Transcript_19387/g.49331 Transcript_19387/m.49331 type:complete len:284 (-) Transcript_19387:264-1115(-)
MSASSFFSLSLSCTAPLAASSAFCATMAGLMPSSAALCSVRLISRSIRSMVSAPTWLSMMTWWNWEKLETEKKTDTMLMHRSMERFISSRISRASVCSSVSWDSRCSKFSVCLNSCAIMPVALIFLAMSSSYRSSMYESSSLRYAGSYCFCCTLKIWLACCCWRARISAASSAAMFSLRGAIMPRLGFSAGGACGAAGALGWGGGGLAAMPPPPRRCCSWYSKSSTVPTLEGWISLHLSTISLASSGTLVPSLRDFTVIFLLVLSLLRICWFPAPSMETSWTS